ncbi:hypothetical protein BC826DRAFT_1187957 [Russula brevipes]|nr:hypothetical protein BC826DRAFT_1187957 [Russula brevipes]
MFTSNQAVRPSTDKFTAIFNIAKDEYWRLTGKDLRKHPFAAELDTCRKPEDISNLLQAQAQAFSKFTEGDKKLMKWLGPTVNILFTFSATLEGVALIPFSPAKTIFTGIGVLLGAVRDDAASHESLIQLFERIRNFLQRLERYVRNLFTDELTELLGNIMAQLLSIHALSTKVMLDGRIKNAVRRLAGRTDIEDAVSRLDTLTRDENLVVVAKSLELLYKAQRMLLSGIPSWAIEAYSPTGDQLRRDFRTWLSPPDPSVNHNTACKSQHSGTCKWFIEGDTYKEWKKNGSLLWIRGNPGAGKSVLCSAVIEDVKKTQNTTPASIAYYYFDYKDVSKRDMCRDGSDQPSDAHLAKCFGTMVEQPGQGPIFVIIDALDECPSTTGTPSAREEVLDFVEDLVGSKHPNLFICVTSRPEQDIRAVLNPLTSPSCRVSLHEEDGQSEDINSYIRSFVDTDRKMRRWREEDRELVITTLSERAGGMFRWVFCQLDTLRRCMPSSIRKALEGLPTTLDDTYERMLQGIPKEQKQHAHHLFQCLVAASRPLRVEELAEIFAIEFDTDTGHNLMENWRPRIQKKLCFPRAPL